MSVIQFLHRHFRKTGYDVVLYTPDEHPLARRKQILDLYGVTLVLDVGANAGQYGSQLREIGYRGRILSFEPLRAPFAQLTARAQGDRHWACFNHALGDAGGSRTINVAGNSYSSSMLKMLPSHLEADPESVYVGTEAVEVKTLDAVFGSLAAEDDCILLKLDTQGFEKPVLDGAAQALRQIDTVEMEISMEPLYEGSLLFPKMYGLMQDKGYRLVSIENEFRDRNSGRLLQVQATFHRFA